MWVIGGGTYNSPRTFNNDVWSSADGKNWELVTEKAPWQARQYQSVTVFDNKIWVMGGYGDDYTNLADAWYSPDGKTWTQVQDVPWLGRHAGTAVVHDGSLWLVAGSNGGLIYSLDDAWKLSYGP